MASVDYVFDPYVVEGYAPNDYVLDPYIADDYVSQATQGSATLVASATLASTGGFLQQSTSTLASATTQTSTATITRTSTSTVSSSVAVSASAVVTRSGTSVQNANANLQTNAVAQLVSSLTLAANFVQSSAASSTLAGTVSLTDAFNAQIFAVATVSPSSIIDASATLSSSADRTRNSSAELITAGDEVYWDIAGTWAEPRSDIWGPLFVVSAVKAVGATIVYDFPVESTLSADGDRTAVANITADGFANISVSATKTVFASSTQDSVATQTTNAVSTSGVIEQVFSSTTALSASGIYQVAGYPNPLAVNTTLSADGDRIAAGVATLEWKREPKIISRAVGTEVSTDQAKFGTKSLYIATLFQYITVPADAKFGIGDFTVDMWIYKSNITTGTYTLFDNRSSGDGLVVRISSNRIGVLATGDSVITYSATTNFTNSTWHHVAFTRSGTTLKVYVDGTEVITHTVVDNNWNYTAAIGNLLTSPVGFTGGYIDEVRFSTGIRYTGNFTSPTSAFGIDDDTRFLFHADNGIVDDSAPNYLTLTGNEFRIRFGVKELNVAASISADSDRIASGIVSANSIADLQSLARQFKGPYQQEFTARFTQSCNGGRLRDGVATLDAFYSTLSALTIFNIDPFRVYTVPTESRIAVIEADTRIFAVKTENRVNTLEAETRTYNLGSESRYLVVQPLRLVEQAGTLDRREG